MTSDDLNSEKGEVYRKHLIKTLQEATGQFKELAVSLRQKMSVGLPQVWIPNSNDMYQFPLDLVAHVVPVVVVDFNDKKYDESVSAVFLERVLVDQTELGKQGCDRRQFKHGSQNQYQRKEC